MGWEDSVVCWEHSLVGWEDPGHFLTFSFFRFLFFVCSGLGGFSSGNGDTFCVRCSRRDAEQGSGVAACLMCCSLFNVR